VVAVGDVHGNLRALASILLHMGLISKKGRWKGSETHLVLVGDVMERHEDSRLLMEFLLRLEIESRMEGGAVHCLLGNQDVPVRYRKGIIRPMDRFFRPWSHRGRISDEFPAMMRYGSWLRSRNAILRIGETLFLHAGLGDWTEDYDPPEMNSTIRSWIGHWHGLCRMPHPRSMWIIGGRDREREPDLTGPLWTRDFKPRRKKKVRQVPRKSAPGVGYLEGILDDLKVERMVIGHNPVGRKGWVTSHPCYGDLVCSIDTGISRKSGRLSCIEIDEGRVTSHFIKPSKSATKVRKAEKRRLKEGNWIDTTMTKEFQLLGSDPCDECELPSHPMYPLGYDHVQATSLYSYSGNPHSIIVES
jgi:hypothetical protein